MTSLHITKPLLYKTSHHYAMPYFYWISLYTVILYTTLLKLDHTQRHVTKPIHHVTKRHLTFTQLNIAALCLTQHNLYITALYCNSPNITFCITTLDLAIPCIYITIFTMICCVLHYNYYTIPHITFTTLDSTVPIHSVTSQCIK